MEDGTLPARSVASPEPLLHPFELDCNVSGKSSSYMLSENIFWLLGFLQATTGAGRSKLRPRPPFEKND